MNFAWEKHNRKAILLEKDEIEIVCWRRQYLRSIKQYRIEQSNIYYLDETWIKEGYVVQNKKIKISAMAAKVTWKDDQWLLKCLLKKERD